MFSNPTNLIRERKEFEILGSWHSAREVAIARITFESKGNLHRAHTHMTSPVGGGSGSPKGTEGGKGSKNLEILWMSYVYAP